MAEHCDKHEDFHAIVNIAYLEDIKRYRADVKINCKACGTPFHFIGVTEYGMLSTAPTVEVGGTELRLPIAPGELGFPVEDGAPRIVYELDGRATSMDPHLKEIIQTLREELKDEKQRRILAQERLTRVERDIEEARRIAQSVLNHNERLKIQLTGLGIRPIDRKEDRKP